MRIGAKIGDEDVGFMAYRPEEGVCKVISIATKYHNKGIGRRLMYEVMVLGPVYLHAEKSAEKFYERLGFVHDGYGPEGRKRYVRD